MIIVFHDLTWTNLLIHLWNGVLMFMLMGLALMLVEQDNDPWASA